MLGTVTLVLAEITVCPDYPTEFLQGFNKIRAYQTLMYQMKIFESYK